MMFAIARVVAEILLIKKLFFVNAAERPKKLLLGFAKKVF
jgi:hypothetical protein